MAKKERRVREVRVYEDGADWYVSYLGTDGRRKTMRLDAGTLMDAKHEVSHLLDIPENKIEY